MFLNVLIIVLQLDYKRGMNGDIRAMVEGKLVKKTEGRIGEILVKIVVKIKKVKVVRKTNSCRYKGWENSEKYNI